MAKGPHRQKTVKKDSPSKALELKRIFRKPYTAGTRFYRACPLDVWWNEFFASRNKDGSLKYPTAWNFIKSKTDDDQERTWLWQAIGPKPIVDTRKKCSVPHLGDWQKTRGLMLTVENPEVKGMQKILDQRLDGLEAGRGVAQVVLKLIGEYLGYSEKIAQVFGNDPVLEELSPEKNEERAKIFFGLKSRVHSKLMEFLELYLKCHGITQDDMTVLANAAAVGANAALKGAAVGAMVAQPQSPVLQQMMESFAEKARIFKMPLPDGEVIEVTEDEKALVKNGHKNGRGN